MNNNPLQMNEDSLVACNLLNVQRDREFSRHFDVFAVESVYSTLRPTGIRKTYETEDHPIVIGLANGERKAENGWYTNFYCLMPGRLSPRENQEALFSAVRSATCFDPNKKDAPDKDKFIPVNGDQIRIKKLKPDDVHQVSDRVLAELLLNSLMASCGQDFLAVTSTGYMEIVESKGGTSSSGKAHTVVSLPIQTLYNPHPFDEELLQQIHNYDMAYWGAEPAYLSMKLCLFSNHAEFVGGQLKWMKKSVKKSEELKEKEKELNAEFSRAGYWQQCGDFVQGLPVHQRNGFGKYRLIQKSSSKFKTARQSNIPYVYMPLKSGKEDRKSCLGVAVHALATLNAKYAAYGVSVNFTETDQYEAIHLSFSKNSTAAKKEYERMMDSLEGHRIVILNADVNDPFLLKANQEIAKNLKQALNAAKQHTVEKRADWNKQKLNIEDNPLDIEIKEVPVRKLTEEINDTDIFVILIPDKDYCRKHHILDPHQKYPGKNVQHIAINLSEFDKNKDKAENDRKNGKKHTLPYGLSFSERKDGEFPLNGLSPEAKAVLTKMARREDNRSQRMAMEDIAALELEQPLRVWLRTRKKYDQNTGSHWYEMTLHPDGRLSFQDEPDGATTCKFPAAHGSEVILNCGDQWAQLGNSNLVGVMADAEKYFFRNKDIKFRQTDAMKNHIFTGLLGLVLFRSPNEDIEGYKYMAGQATGTQSFPHGPHLKEVRALNGNPVIEPEIILKALKTSLVHNSRIPVTPYYLANLIDHVRQILPEGHTIVWNGYDPVDYKDYE